ncbi:hypothetical protein Sste5346_008243 [Sporothrix stenoceras]|uniref:G-patch domain-containing protein n=1 Tax=Sporothrix stenoceras TaxID=5173 RepID=A0ABR3YQ32_9PEZI
MADDEEDDYMTMTFVEEETGASKKNNKKKHVAETSLQRRIRLEREGRERGRVPSKAELAKTAEAEREAALSRSLFDGPKKAAAITAATSKWPSPPTAPAPKPVSKGFAMMAKMGFVAGQSLGKKRGGNEEGKEDGQDRKDDRPITEPIRIQVKRDRAGIGAEEEKREREREKSEKEGDGDGPETKRLRLDDMDPMEYRDRLRQEREAGRLERQIHAAQVVAERMARGDEEEDDSQHKDDMPLSEVNVLWRGLVKERRTKEHEREQRIKAQRLLDDRLRSIVHGDKEKSNYTAFEQDGSDDDDDKNDLVAHGKADKLSYLKGGMNKSIPVDGEDDDEDEDATKEVEDAQLDEFNALEPQERLQQVVDWMRQNRRYCFWCKFKYPDDDLEGCPGPTEEDHD